MTADAPTPEEVAALSGHLRDLQGADHERGCAGRFYGCSCGHDFEVEKGLYEAAAMLTSLSADRDRWEHDANQRSEWHQEMADALTAERTAHEETRERERRLREGRDAAQVRADQMAVAMEESTAILFSLTENIRRHGNYSPETTVTFVGQAIAALAASPDEEAHRE